MYIRESAYSERQTQSGARCFSNKTVRKCTNYIYYSITIATDFYSQNAGFYIFQTVPSRKGKNNAG